MRLIRHIMLLWFVGPQPDTSRSCKITNGSCLPDSLRRRRPTNYGAWWQRRRGKKLSYAAQRPGRESNPRQRECNSDAWLPVTAPHVISSRWLIFGHIFTRAWCQAQQHCLHNNNSDRATEHTGLYIQSSMNIQQCRATHIAVEITAPTLHTDSALIRSTARPRDWFRKYHSSKMID